MRPPGRSPASIVPLVVLATLWAGGPLLPAVLAGGIPGAPWTDLYPAVWGLGWFAGHQPGLPTFAPELNAPTGMPFYYASPLHGWAGTPLVALGGAALAYTVTLVAARLATVLVAFGALRAIGLERAGASAGALLYGASPFFHGYAVEGIVEGTDGWTLALWAWAVARDRRLAAAAALALTVLSSWYLGMVACFLAAGWGLARRTAWVSLGGLLPAAPFVGLFLGAATGAAPLPDAVRAAMGAPLRVAPPGWSEGVNGFALNAWVGVTGPALALVGLTEPRRRPWALALVACAVLSLGLGPWYELPVLRSVRFPYRWHAGTLFALAVLAGAGVDRLRRPWLLGLPALEGWLLSPVEPVLPASPDDVPAIYDRVRASVLLEVPGPLALPPGEVNLSRPRARYLLYFQLHHGAASPWAPDFNGVAATAPAPWLDAFASWDPLARREPLPLDLASARAAGVTEVMVHRDELRRNAEGFEAALAAAGASRVAEEGELALWSLP